MEQLGSKYGFVIRKVSRLNPSLQSSISKSLRFNQGHLEEAKERRESHDFIRIEEPDKVISQFRVTEPVVQ